MKLNQLAPAIALAALAGGAWSGPLDLSAFQVIAPIPTIDLAIPAQDAGPVAQADDGQETDGDQAMDAELVARNLQATYDEITDFQATFVQESTQIAWAEPRTSGGSVYFMRPGRMLWDYDGDANGDGRRRLILDGENIHTVDFDNTQYYSAPVASSDLPTAMRFLVGQGELAADFQIELLPESTADRAVLDLVPHEPTGEYERLLFVIDTATWSVLETTIVDAIGNTNTIRFEELRTNIGMDASAFAFAPMDGFTRLDIP